MICLTLMAGFKWCYAHHMNSPTREQTIKKQKATRSLLKKKLPDSLYRSAGLLRHKATGINAEIRKIRSEWKAKSRKV